MDMFSVLIGGLITFGVVFFVMHRIADQSPALMRFFASSIWFDVILHVLIIIVAIPQGAHVFLSAELAGCCVSWYLSLYRRRHGYAEWFTIKLANGKIIQGTEAYCDAYFAKHQTTGQILDTRREWTLP